MFWTKVEDFWSQTGSGFCSLLGFCSLPGFCWGATSAHTPLPSSPQVILTLTGYSCVLGYNFGYASDHSEETEIYPVSLSNSFHA